MKRFLALIIIVVTIIPLFAFPIGAEESATTGTIGTTFTVFENEQYTYIACGGDKTAEAFKERLIDILEAHTEVPYNKLQPSGDSKEPYISIIIDLSGTMENTYANTSDFNILTIFLNEGNSEEYLNKLSQQIQASPKDKVVLDESFFTVVTDADLERLEHEKKEKEKKDKEKEDNEGGFFKNAGKVFLAIVNFFDIFEMDSENVGDTLTSGGFNLIEPEGELNKMIGKIYNVLYPIGFITMLLCWGFGIAKSTISSSLDIKDKSSIMYSILSLILGVSAMSLSPKILTFLTGASRQLCEKIGSAEVSCISEEYFKQTNFLDMIIGGAEMGVTTLLVVLFVDLIFMVNILWIALLQCLSPIFIGLMANQGTRKMSFNFIKEYFKALLIPVVTVCYWCLVATFQADFNNLGTGTGIIAGLLGSIVLAISTLSIAGKKLDKLIN